MESIELDARERAFVAAALRRGVTQSTLVILFAVATTISGLIGTIAWMESAGSMAARFAFALGGICFLCRVLAALSARQGKRRDAMLAIDRCGCCGHHLKGNERPIQRDIRSKTCNECGTVWTDLDRRDSISLIYDCA